MTAYVTPNGTHWQSYSATMADGSVARKLVPDSLIASTGGRCLLYFHGAGAGSTQFETLPAWAALRNKLMDNGWIVVESSGGPTSAEGQQNQGNYKSRISYGQGFVWADTTHLFAHVVTLGRSMGGPNAYYFGTRHPTIAARVDGMIINSGVSNLLALNDVGPEGTPIVGTVPLEYSGSGKLWPTIWEAYGVEDHDEFAASAEVADCDPYRYNPAVFTGKNLLQLYGTVDQTVPHYSHGQLIRTRYSGLAAQDLAVIGVGRDHSAPNGMYSYADDMFNFAISVTGGTPPATAKTYHRVLRSSRNYPGVGLRAVTHRGLAS